MASTDFEDGLERPLALEGVNRKTLQALEGMLGPIGTMMLDWALLDASLGRGVLKDKYQRCLWLNDGRRITIDAQPGHLITSISKKPDRWYGRIKTNGPNVLLLVVLAGTREQFAQYCRENELDARHVVYPFRPSDVAHLHGNDVIRYGTWQENMASQEWPFYHDGKHLEMLP